MRAMDIIREAQREVAIFEDPISFVLQPCTADEVVRVGAIANLTIFVANVYALVRRVEAAAAKYADEDNDEVRQAYAVVQKLILPINAMREHVESIPANSDLEEAGKEGLLERLGWALWVLTERLPDWGY